MTNELLEKDRLRRQEAIVVAQFQSADKALAAAREAVAAHVLEVSGIAKGQLVRTVNHCVYRVENGSGWVNQGKPHMVLTTRRVYRGGKTAASSSTHWASSLTPLTSDQAHRWINGEDVAW
jgi:hypothetical protein